MKDFKERYKLGDYFADLHRHERFQNIANLFYENKKSILNGNFVVLNGNIDYVDSVSTYRKFAHEKDLFFPGFTKGEIKTIVGLDRDYDQYTYDVLEGTLSSSDYLADMISYENGNCAIIELINKVYDMKPNRKNYMQSAYDIENGRKFLASALERECNAMIKKFQNNEISRRTFEKYTEIYEDCKKNKLPQMVSNWEKKQELRDQLQLADARRIERKNQRANLKATLKSNIKTFALKIKRIPSKLKKLYAEKAEYKERKLSIKKEYEDKRRQEIIDDFNKKREM